LSSELLILPPLRCGENQEFETDAPPGHCSTAALSENEKRHTKILNAFAKKGEYNHV